MAAESSQGDGEPVSTARIGRCSIRPAVPVVEAREDRVRQSYIHREAEEIVMDERGAAGR